MKVKSFKRFGMFAESIPLPSGHAVEVRCKGPLTIQPASDGQLGVMGVGQSRVEQTEDRVIVRGNGPVSIKAPENVVLSLNVHGPVKVATLPSVRLQVQNVTGPLIIDAIGDLSFDRITGPVIATDIRGDIQGRQIKGPITLKRGRGDIHIENAIGPLTVDAIAGDVDLTLRGDAFIHPTGDREQTVRIRSRDSVYLTLPADARVQGHVRAGEGVRVELDQGSMTDAEVTLTPGEGEGPVITLDIEAEGEVYLGPNPPATAPQPEYTKTTGKGWLARIFESLGGSEPRPTSQPRPRPRSAPSSAPKPGVSDEQAMILKMVAEGKITAEEADKLLEALS
ncbi:MAG TPA: hypothetical protein ENK30_04350 [Anaerolineae bacterium]|nr:hypothetical protein [Anaerolineae bacterium]